MSGLEITIRLAAVAVLGTFLYVRLRRRARDRQCQHDSGWWTGTSIDTVRLESAVGRVRCSPLEARLPASGTGFRVRWLGSTRQAVARLAYFHDRESEQPAPAHGP